MVNTENNPKITYEHKELVLDMIVRLYKMPDFITELYVNYDCDLYTHNIFEDLTKMLSKNAFPVAGFYSTQFLSLQALLTVVESVEQQCEKKVDESGQIRHDENAIISKEQLMKLKQKKKQITTTTELFNNKPSKGVAHMQECGLIKSPLDAQELAQFLRANPHLSKNQLGEFISKRDNSVVLKAFVESFEFQGLRVDESLRMFLEAFRLPGEAPLISLIVEHFSEHWQSSNGNLLANADAAYTLSYAIIMLNVDQHNKNHTKTNDPMTAEQFKRNLRGTNGNQDHDQDMLDEIYHAIRNEEIVMPAEQTGLVKENYLWKCALKRGMEDDNKKGQLLGSNVMFDHDLFSIIWGPAIAALSYVFDKSRINKEGAAEDIEKSLNGFERCAKIAAHYRMNEVLDNIVISLCKFSTLTKATEDPYLFVPLYGSNVKALMATKTVLLLVHRHGDILHDGWKNLLDCLLWLFKCQLLPKTLMEVEDFVDTTGKVKLLPDDVAPNVAKVESGFLNSFVSWMSSGEAGGAGYQRPRTPEEEESAEKASRFIKECQTEALITDSKFLQKESLKQLVKQLIISSNLDQFKHSNSQNKSASERTSPNFDADADEEVRKDEAMAVFFFELLARVTIQNKDRVNDIWNMVVDHTKELIIVAADLAVQDTKPFLLERTVNSLLRLAVRLARKEDLASMVVQQSLSILLNLSKNPQALTFVARHISFGLHELLRNNAANIHKTEDWSIIFGLMEVIGADVEQQSKGDDADSGHGASSESSDSRNASPGSPVRERSGSVGSSSGGWIVLDKTGGEPKQQISHQKDIINCNSLVESRPIVIHDSLAFLKCCESLAFLVRDVAHITPHNFNQCVLTLRIFVEASFSGRVVNKPDSSNEKTSEKAVTGGGSKSAIKRTPFKSSGPPSAIRKVRSAPHNVRSATSVSTPTGSDYDGDESDNEDLSSEFHHVALQLLDLLHTLHTRAAQIHLSWAEEDSGEVDPESSTKLWSLAWCPILQSMAILCCDRRSHIRTSALTTLQRSLLFHDLQTLSSNEWESAFTHVLFPMMNQLLIPSQPGERTAMEEVRTRAATLLGKVFLQHLTPLTSLSSFTVSC